MKSLPVDENRETRFLALQDLKLFHLGSMLHWFSRSAHLHHLSGSLHQQLVACHYLHCLGFQSSLCTVKDRGCDQTDKNTSRSTLQTESYDQV